MDIKNNPIGFFDSGVGGLSVLRETISIMPNENYIYFGDSKNAPYGTKKVGEVRELSFRAADFLLSRNVKAIVVACNTATSAAIEKLRERYDIPVIGIEPAIKPAFHCERKGKVVVMATPMTLHEKKFNTLLEKLNEKDRLISLPCPRLVEFVENGILEGEELQNYLTEKLSVYCNDDISSIVLGCTHFPFVKRTIAKIVGEDIPLIDGSHGTSMELKRKLIEKNILSDSTDKGYVKIYNSNNDSKVVDFCYNLINTK